MNGDSNKGLKKDLRIMLIGIIPMAVITFILHLLTKGGQYFIPEYIVYVIYLFTLPVLFVSYLEAKENDPFVTGKTQTIGVNNSFTGAFFIAFLTSKGSFLIGAANYIVLCALLLIVREIGRKKGSGSSHKANA